MNLIVVAYKREDKIGYIRTRFTFPFQMYFLLVSFFISELKYNEEVRKFNRTIEGLHQKNEQIKNAGWEIIKAPHTMF